jgi:hypothetical protein
MHKIKQINPVILRNNNELSSHEMSLDLMKKITAMCHPKKSSVELGIHTLLHFLIYVICKSGNKVNINSTCAPSIVLTTKG